MNTQPVISVRGEAIMEVEPEIATISVTVQARDRDRRTVLDNLTTRTAQAITLIKGYGDAVENLESGTASVYPDMKNKAREERIIRYLARANTRVTVKDFTVLGELVAKLADGDLVTVTGPWWSLRPDSPVYREARIAAAKDAIRRAGEYAEAFNVKLGQLIEAADKGLLSGRDEPTDTWVAGGLPTARGVSYAGEQPGLDFEPAKRTSPPTSTLASASSSATKSQVRSRAGA
jgi:uncharacterized protein